MPVRMQAAGPPYPPEVQSQLDRLTPPGKAPLALFTLLARDPRLFQRFMGGALLDKGNLTLRQREIVIARTTALNDCEYEWGVHVALFGAKVALTPAQIHSLVRGSANDDCWTDELEQILLRTCDALHTGSTVPDELWEGLSGRLSEPALLEVLMLAGFYRTVSYLANSTQLALEPFAAHFPPKAA